MSTESNHSGLRVVMARAAAWAGPVLACGTLVLGCTLRGPVDRTTPPIVLITIDTLRADSLSFDGLEAGTTPYLDRLARQGSVFAQAYAASSWTPPSMASLMTSLVPSSHGIVSGAISESGQVTQPVLSPSIQTLAESLHEAGYTTIGVPASRHLSGELGFAQGFDYYYEKADFLDAHQLGDEIHRQMERAFGADWRRLWKLQPQKTFLWIHYFDPHDPYEPRAPWIDVYAPLYRQAPQDYPASLPMPQLAQRFKADPGPQWAQRIRPLYRSEVSFVDAELGHLMSELDIDDQTLVLVTADHGEEIVDHGALGHAFSLYEELIHVPLLVRWPQGLPSGRCIGQPVSLLDVAPTLIELAGGTPVPAFQGHSLVPLLRGGHQPDPQPLLCELKPPKPTLDSIRDGAWKLIQRQGAQPVSQLYNLASDPAEHTDLAAQNPQVVARLEGEMRKRLAALPPAPQEQRVVLQDEEARKQLEALGYVGH